ncbi:MAG TPA: cellulase family glycosylhydrolase [Roseiflexaceae bacterium]|nr:cellulase family glycosylhydrolase [Roseiflexaceae bacterium]
MLAAFPAILAACGTIAQAPGTTPTPAGIDAPTSIPATTPEPSTAPTATAGQPPQGLAPIRLPQLEFGVVGHLYYTDRSRVLQLAQIAGFDWFRQQIHWRDIEDAPGSYKWGEIDNVVASAAASGVKLLVNIVRSPDFYGTNSGKPRDPQALGNLVAALIDRFGDRIAAYEIWNEPNLAYENGGRVRPDDAGQYVEILAECYRRIKSLNPNLIVVAAAPSSTGVNNETIALADQEYLKLMYSYRNGMIRDYFDVQAVHPGAAANDPDWLYPEVPGDRPGWNDHPTHYFRHVENTRALMVEYGLGDRQIWLTEYGWATVNNTPGYEFGNLLSLETQADYISRAVTRVYQQYRDQQGRPWVGAMFLWNLNFAVLWGAQGNPEHEQASFSILNPDWSPRPSFIALQGLHQRIKAEQGRAYKFDTNHDKRV